MAGRRGRPRKTNIAVEMKDNFEAEKLDLRKATEKRISQAKASNKIEKTWYVQRPNGRVYKYVQMTNGNKYSKLAGNIKTRPELKKLLES